MKTQDIKNMGQALQQVQESAKAALAKKLAKASASSEKGKAAVTLPKAPFDIPKKGANEALKGDQHKLDHDDDGDIDAADFKKLRNKKKGEKSEVKPRQETDTDKGQGSAEGKVDEVSMDTAKSAYYKRKSQAQGAAAQGSMDYAKKQMAKARKTKAYIDKRESVEEAVDLEMHKKAAANHAAKAKPVGNRWPKGAEKHDNAAKAHQHVINMHKKFGADHDGTKDAIAAAKAASKKAPGMKESTKWPVYARIMEKQSHTAGATAPEEMDSKDSPSAKKMKKDHKPEVNDTEAKGHVDAAEAGRKGPSAKARANDNMKGDKNVVNPVKGAVTNGSN